MDINPQAKAKELGIAWPSPPRAVADYVPAALHGNMIHVSGQLPMRDGELVATGAAPSAVSLQQAQDAAAQCAINALAVVGEAVDGDWSRLERVIRLGVFVYSDPGFHDQHKVANGASEMLGKLLGEAGRHVRAAVGAGALPLGASVEAELTAAVKESPSR